MLREGQIHFLGSDCHNTTSRPQKMGEALKAIGPEGRQILEENINRFAPEFAPYAAV
jgi:tyrosine-protein phosphatase YwqE